MSFAVWKLILIKTIKSFNLYQQYPSQLALKLGKFLTLEGKDIIIQN